MEPLKRWPRSTEAEVIECLAEVHASLDYELSPAYTGHLWDAQIKRLYKARDEMLEELKRYRR